MKVNPRYFLCCVLPKTEIKLNKKAPRVIASNFVIYRYFVYFSPAESGSEPKQLTARQQYIIGRFMFMKGHTLTRGKTLNTMSDDMTSQSHSQQVNGIRLRLCYINLMKKWMGM